MIKKLPFSSGVFSIFGSISELGGEKTRKSWQQYFSQNNPSQTNTNWTIDFIQNLLNSVDSGVTNLVAILVKYLYQYILSFSNNMKHTNFQGISTPKRRKSMSFFLPTSGHRHVDKLTSRLHIQSPEKKGIVGTQCVQKSVLWTLPNTLFFPFSEESRLNFSFVWDQGIMRGTRLRKEHIQTGWYTTWLSIYARALLMHGERESVSCLY